MTVRAAADSNYELFRVIASMPGIVVAEVGLACVAIWREEVTDERFHLQRRGLAEVVGRYPKRAVFLCMVEQSSGPPSKRMRRASVQMVEELSENLRCVAGVCEGDGILVTISRTVMLWFVQLITRSNVPMEFFRDVPSAHHWLCKHTDMHPLETFMRTIEFIRTQLDVLELRKRIELIEDNVDP